jgi:hypothetical protein
VIARIWSTVRASVAVAVAVPPRVLNQASGAEPPEPGWNPLRGGWDLALWLFLLIGSLFFIGLSVGAVVRTRGEWRSWPTRRKVEFAAAMSFVFFGSLLGLSFVVVAVVMAAR